MKIAALTPFPIIPANFGGAERCFNLLSRIGPVDVHALSWEGQAATVVLGDMVHRATPVSPAASQRSQRLQGAGIQTFDAMPHLTHPDLGNFQEAVLESGAELFILEHPWLVDFVGSTPFIYDSHNAEAFSFAQRFTAKSPEFFQIKDLERRAVTQAAHVTYCSEADAGVMREMYGDFSGSFIPNGTSLPDLATRNPDRSLLFVGSMYQPNVDAAQRLINLAPLLPEYEIRIAGQCSYFVSSNNCSNVELLGPVSDEKLHALFLQAYAFVNLIFAGSGTHLKIARALSYGVPVITTPLGARGYYDLLVTTPEAVPSVLREIPKDYSSLSTQARQQAEALSWDRVAQSFTQVINATLQ
jgi:glycosyltransferase involved in cell wall biosynthesis